MSKHKQVCDRCNKPLRSLSPSVIYHPKCFDEMYAEAQIIAKAPKPRRPSRSLKVAKKPEETVDEKFASLIGTRVFEDAGPRKTDGVSTCQRNPDCTPTSLPRSGASNVAVAKP